MKNPVKRIMATKTLNKPQIKEKSSIFDLELRLTPTKIGIIGKIHGDNIEIIPVKKEKNGKISI